jgi:hypothetical protein
MWLSALSGRRCDVTATLDKLCARSSGHGGFDRIDGGDDRSLSTLTKKRHGSFDFRAHRTGWELSFSLELHGVLHRQCAEVLLIRLAVMQGNSFDIGGDEKGIGSDLLSQFGARQVLINHGINPVKGASFPDDGDTAATTTDHHEIHL